MLVVTPCPTESKKDSKDQESIQSSTTPDPGYHMNPHLSFRKQCRSLPCRLREFTVLFEIMQLNWPENRSECTILVYSASEE